MLHLPFQIPVEPDPDTARAWIVDELAKSEYTGGGRSWFQRVMDWIAHLVQGRKLPTGDFSFGGVPGAVVVIVIVVLVAAAVAYVVMGRVAPSRRAGRSARVFEDDDRTADAMAQEARDAAARGDWDTAVLESFRALVRRSEDLHVVTVAPGMTALEFVLAAGARLAESAPDLAWAGDLFDGVRYGHARGARADFERLERLRDSIGSRDGVSA